MERMVYELRGLPCIGLEEVTPDRKSIIASRSFGHPVTSRAELGEAVRVFCSRAAVKARRQELAAVALGVFIETNRFKPELPQYDDFRSMRLAVARADTGRLIAAATRLLERMYRPGFTYKKADVVFLELVPAGAVQASLFERPDDDKSKARRAALDAINAKYGRGTLGYGFTGEQQRWKLRTDHISPRYATDWDGLLRV